MKKKIFLLLAILFLFVDIPVDISAKNDNVHICVVQAWDIGRFLVARNSEGLYRAYTDTLVSKLHNTAYKAVKELK